MATLELRQVSKQFHGPRRQIVEAVREVSLQAADGEFLVLVGPSGCGKSTILRLIAGLEEPSSGEILLDGRVVNDVEPKDRDIAMVFQNYALYPHMTVYENMAFGLKLRKTPKAEICRRVQETAALLGLEEVLERLPKALSGGQRQRVALGRAIVRQPRVFLFDEPLSNLDAKMRVQMRVELARLHQRLGTTMVYVTHDQVEAMTLGQRIAVMNAGRLQQLAAPMELYRRPANLFVAGFIGSPPMNLVPGRIERAEGQTVFRPAAAGLPEEAGAWPLNPAIGERLPAADGADVVLGVRPETLRLTGEANPDRVAFPATVELVEPLGAETLLHLRVGPELTLVCRVASGPVAKAGEIVPVGFAWREVSWFDAADGRALWHPDGPA
ncbi:MAG: sn-glycerol-3-phosphate ABC transporter ATP-binding protein UgpC [Verrucomicrobia bacterium]|nr:MAG: sn-glycerol-3-phosphate ABC transporter ATP-binding protein UgpC [Verrucomicrobiota bacterium]